MSDNARTDSNSSLPPPSALESILLGGLVVGVLDILDAPGMRALAA